MKKFVQIVDKKAYWIFDVEVDPVFAPNIVLVDITGRGDIQEGWDYDVSTNTFSGPVPKPPELSLNALNDNQMTIMNATADLYIMLSDIQAALALVPKGVV